MIFTATKETTPRRLSYFREDLPYENDIVTDVEAWEAITEWEGMTPDTFRREGPNLFVVTYPGERFRTLYLIPKNRKEGRVLMVYGIEESADLPWMVSHIEDKTWYDQEMAYQMETFQENHPDWGEGRTQPKPCTA